MLSLYPPIIHDNSPPSYLIYSIIKTEKSQMKKISILTLFILFVNIAVNCQITKGNWLAGGSGTFSHSKATFSTGGEYISTNIDISPRFGYFVADRFAIGLYGNYTWGLNKSNNIKASYSNYGIGPFIRYYFLSVENKVNLLVETNGSYNEQTNNQLKTKSGFFSYNALAGPVIFLNSSVGVEFLLGYKGYKETKTETKNNGVYFSIGIQYHLEKDK